MAITHLLVPVLGLAAVIAMVLSLFGKLAGSNSVPAAVIGGVSVYLFGSSVCRSGVDDV